MEEASVLLVPSGPAGLTTADKDSPTEMRLKAAAQAIRTTPSLYAAVVLSGGYVNGTTADALDMHARWNMYCSDLRALVITEERSRDSFENCQFTLEELSRAGITVWAVSVVTNQLHWVRFWLSMHRKLAVKFIDSQESSSLVTNFKEIFLYIPIHALFPKSGGPFGWLKSHSTFAFALDRLACTSSWL